MTHQGWNKLFWLEELIKYETPSVPPSAHSRSLSSFGKCSNKPSIRPVVALLVPDLEAYNASLSQNAGSKRGTVVQLSRLLIKRLYQDMEINCILNDIEPLHKDATAVLVYKTWIT